jgi:hypothetical protein
LFFEKINKIDKPLVKPFIRKRGMGWRWTQEVEGLQVQIPIKKILKKKKKLR